MPDLLITGARSDIGQALLGRVVGRGHKILATSRSDAGPDKAGGASILRGIDLTRETSLDALRDAARSTFDRPFCWVHSVGDFWSHKPIAKTQMEEVVSMMTSHYLTLYAASQVVLPIMKDAGGGQILAFSCNSVRYNYPDMAAFTSAKAAVECLIKCISNEYLRDRITANCFTLPTIRTEKVLQTKQPEYHQYYLDVDDLASEILRHLDASGQIITGNSINLVKHSPYFYNEGYYRRNRE